MIEAFYSPKGIPTSITQFIPINVIKPILEKVLMKDIQGERGSSDRGDD
jgi:hypothetical protein